MASGDISVVADISYNTGICGLLAGLLGANADSGISGADLTQTKPTAAVKLNLTTDAGVLLTTDAGVQLTTSG